MAVTLFLTPYILHGLGIVRYGLFVLTGSMVGVLGTLDGGIKATARRYFGVYAGGGDTARITQLLATLLVIISAFGVAMSLAGWFIAPLAVSLLKMPSAYRSQTTFLFRTLGVLLAASFIHNLFVAILQAYGRFPYIVKAGFATYAVWAAGLYCTVRFSWGLKGIAGVFLVQQVLLTLTIMPSALKYVHRQHLRFLPRSELTSFLAFGMRVQVSTLSALVNFEFDNLLLGVALSVKATSLYNSGANFAQNVQSLVASVMGPVQTRLANTFGSAGGAAAFHEFCRVQRIVVTWSSGFFAVAAASSWFAITAWLGPVFSTGGAVGVLLLLSMCAYISAMVVTTYCSIAGRPGLESRYGLVSVCTNAVLTVPLLLVGPLGVAAATATGQVVGLAYLVRIVRRDLQPDLPSPLRLAPFMPLAAAAAVVVAGELALRPLVPSGGLGLVACAAPAIAGLAVFAAGVLGPVAFVRLVLQSLSETRSSGPRAGVHRLLTALQ